MISSNVSEAEEYLVSLSEQNGGPMEGSREDSGESSAEIEIVRELKVTLDVHQCDLCCRGSFLVDKLLQFGGIAGKYMCEVCLKSFRYKDKAVAHARRHDDTEADNPVVCCKTGEPVGDPRAAVATPEADKPFGCSQCTNRYKAEKYLKRHCTKKHGGPGSVKRTRTEDVTPTEESFSCDKCHERFIMEIELKWHKNSHHLENRDVYNVNGSEPESSVLLRGSLSSKLSGDTTPSAEPDETAISSALASTEPGESFIGVMTINDEGDMEVLYSCGRCPEKFKSEKHLKKHHARKHNNGESEETIGAITNDECSTITNNSELNSVYNVEAGHKPNSEDNIEASCEPSSSSGIMSKVWRCDKCQVTLKSQQGLKKHNFNQHGEIHFCHMCGTAFKSSHMFKRHCKLKSCAPPTKGLQTCASCQKSFFFKRSFDEHVCSLDG